MVLVSLCAARTEKVFSENQVWNFAVSVDEDGNTHYTAMNAEGDAPYTAFATSGNTTTCTFSYNDSLPNGPSHWANSCGVEWVQCSLGRQSPVDLVKKNAVTKDTLTFTETYDATSNGAVENNHHTVVALIRLPEEGAKGPQTLSGGPLGSAYELIQFHYHTPSEHLIDGVIFPLELHLVHQSIADPSQYAVIGYLFEPSRDYSSSVLAELMTASQQLTENVTMVPWTITLHNALIPTAQSQEYYNYLGSLTTPPCSEVVTWYVMSTPLYASSAQINYFTNLLGDNARPPLDLGSRTVYFYTPAMSHIYHGALPPGAVAAITLIILVLFFGVISYFVFTVKNSRLYFMGKDTGYNVVGMSLKGCLKKGPPMEDEGVSEDEDHEAPPKRPKSGGKGKGVRDTGTELAAMDESDRGAPPRAKSTKRSEEPESDEEDTRPRRETEKRSDRRAGDEHQEGKKSRRKGDHDDSEGKKSRRKGDHDDSGDDEDYIPRSSSKPSTKSTQKSGRRET